ncbi:MATE family efflux transporter [Parvularcula oceani]|uniref:MATE family efflux transporter n=1 Tax=Parvularcula oceani TaxID=1247963 RepID=UPI0005642AA5|nr:MATE family efflux transporter [Parvularcula oceani]
MSSLPTLRSAFRIAWPASLAAIVTPLLGLIDTAVLTRGGSTADLAGVALAGAVFSLLYWSFGFLRMGLAGLTAQAEGRGDEAGSRAHLVQGVVLGGMIGLVLCVLRTPIADLSAYAMTAGNAASAEAVEAMRSYIEIRLFAAPLALMTTAGFGWLTGQGRTAAMMAVSLSITALNAGLDILFVLEFSMGVEGIALGTALAEGTGALLLALGILRVLHLRGGIRRDWILRRMNENLRGVASLNADIFLRTLILSVVFAYFVRAGGRFGDTVLAANQALMHIVLVTGLFLDGAAIAAETLVGQALGARSGAKDRFAAAVRATSMLSALGAFAMFALLLLFGGFVVETIIPAAENEAVHEAAMRYLPWAVVSPLVLAASFQLDGIYIGATRGSALRNGMILSGLVFVLGMVALPGPLGNDGLWMAFGLFMLARAVTLLAFWPGFAPLTARRADALT